MYKLVIVLFLSIVNLSIVTGQKVRVKILATGGTIAGVGTSEDNDAYKAGVLPIDQLLKAVPEIHKVAEVSGEQIASIGSQDMSVNVWLSLSRRINTIFKNNEADAIVITHGTDTQEETAYFLSLCTGSSKPVVLTGAMHPATADNADGPGNLLDAVCVAASSESKGVLVVFDGKIFPGRDVVKCHTTNTDAFCSPNASSLGEVKSKKVLYNKGIKDTTVHTPLFNIDTITSLPRVDIAYMYADAQPVSIEAFVQAGAKGIVIAGVGNGNYNKAFAGAINEALKKGIAVCRASRVFAGSVTLNNEIDDEAIGTIVSNDLNPQKARILLMLALTQTTDRWQLQKYFFEL